MHLTAQGILFDLDGTLIDSSASVERSWRRFTDRMGIDFDSLNGSHHGVPSRQTINRLLAGAPQAEIDELVRWLDEIEAEDVDGIVVLPGTVELLDALPADRWAIVTSGNHRLATTRLAVTGLPVPAQLVTADDVSRGKPFPDPYLLGAQKLGLAPEQCLVVEDAPAGVTAGLASGAQVLGLRTTHQTLEVQQVDSLADVVLTVDGGRLTLTSR